MPSNQERSRDAPLALIVSPTIADRRRAAVYPKQGLVVADRDHGASRDFDHVDLVDAGQALQQALALVSAKLRPLMDHDPARESAARLEEGLSDRLLDPPRVVPRQEGVAPATIEDRVLDLA